MGFGEMPRADVKEVDRETQADKMVRFLDKLKATEVFGDDESKKDFINSLDFDKFKNFLSAANAMLRDIPLHNRSMDGKDVELAPSKEKDITTALVPVETQYPPRYEDKDELLNELLKNTQEMIKEGAKIEDIALMASAGINAIHSFSDGNGRTSRLVYFLLTENYNKTPEQLENLKKLLSDKGRLHLNINPGAADEAIRDFIFSKELGLKEKDPHMPNWLNELSPGDKTLGELIKERLPENLQRDFVTHIRKQDSSFGFFAVYKYLKDSNRLDEFLVPNYTSRGELRRTDLMLSDVLIKLSPEEIKSILDVYWQIKKQSVSILLDSLRNPEKYTGESGKTIKESMLENMMDEKIASYKEVNYQKDEMEEVVPNAEKMKFERHSIPNQELREIIKIKEKAKQLIEKDKSERDSTNFDVEKAKEEARREYMKRYEINEGDPEYHKLTRELDRRAFDKEREIFKPVLEISENNFQEFLAFLDGLDIWKHKFTTRKESYFTDEQREKTDSIYYVTKSGASIRLLKYYLMEQGLGAAIQPFFEKIIFADEEDESISDKPAEGLRVVEYLTDEFRLQQNQKTVDKDYVSEVRKYKVDGKDVYLNPVDGHMHVSYPINRIMA